METIPWYESAIIRQQIVQLISAALLLLGVSTEVFDVDKTATLIFGGISGVVAIWTMITRLRKPTPPITEEAADRTIARLRKQGGFARLPLLLAVLLAFGTATAVVGVQGCTATRSAYKSAENPAELAYVLTEHYAALVTAAADLATKPTTPASAIRAMQQADAKAKPVVLKLKPLRDAYVAAKSATTEADLQLATNQAVLAIADLVRAINTARGAK